MMKNAVYSLGVIAGLTLLTGLFMKGQMWPGAGVVLTIATLTGILFIPLFAVYQYRKDND